ncbi:MAG: DUF697 domain-containing protein [Alphaproteobacteria bacterium]|nr:MAG: DUF697 domain-containing protein [Alphaproteobacteria bacterium]
MSVSRKKLPNVIRPTIDRAPEGALGNGNGWRGAPEGMLVSDQLVDATGAATESEPVVHVVETMRPSSASGMLSPTPGHSVSPAVDAAKRLTQARAIVERHATYSAVGGILPLPIASVAGITTIIIRMVKMLSSLYGVPFERDRARAIVAGLVGGATPTGFAAVTTSTLFYVVPSGLLLSTVVSAISAVACTRSIGRVFIEHFEGGATLNDFRAPRK